MDHLWTPWRYAYVTATDGAPRPGVPSSLAAWQGDLGCVFCNLIASIDFAIANGMSPDEAEAAGGLVLRGQHCFICLNAYPYTSGHIMVVPYAHLDRLAALTVEAAHEMMDLAQKVIVRSRGPHWRLKRTLTLVAIDLASVIVGICLGWGIFWLVHNA